MKKSLLFSFVTVAFATLSMQHSKAQISVSENDMDPLFGVGKALTWKFDSLALKIADIGKPGGPNNYDFSNASFPLSMNVKVISASSVSTLASRFPSDARVWELNYDQEGAESYSVFNFKSGDLLEYGSLDQGTNFTYVGHNNPPEIIFRFPVTYNSAFDQTVVSLDTLYESDTVSFVESDTASKQVKVDGYGTLWLPGGANYQCLRIRSVEQNNSEFVYVTKEGIVLIVGIEGTADSGVLQTTEMTLIARENVSSVSGPKYDQQAVSIYPNPVSATATVKITITKPGNYKLNLIDLTGRELKILTHQSLEQGDYSFSLKKADMPAGVYGVQLSGEGSVKTEKVIID